MRVFVLLIAMAAVPVGIAGAQTVASVAQAKRLAVIEADIELAKSRLDVLEIEMAGLNERVAGRGVLLNCNAHNYVEIMATSTTYTFLAVCDKIEPYLEGFKLTVKVGNPHSARFPHVTGSIGHGEKIVDAWKDTNKIALSSIDDLAPGSWTDFDVAINPSSAKDVRSIWLEFDTGAVSLPVTKR